MQGGNFTPRLEENKRKVMQSSIFGGNDEKPQYHSPSRQVPPQPIKEQQFYKSPEIQQYRSPPRNVENLPQQNYSFSNSKNTSFSTPSFNGLVHATNIPALSAFPDINLTPIQANDSYDFSLKPRTALRPPKKTLTFKPNNQMKMMRDSLSHDMVSFQQRIQRLNVNTPLNIKMASFDHKEIPKTAVQPKRQPLPLTQKSSSPSKSAQTKQSPQREIKMPQKELYNVEEPTNDEINPTFNMSGSVHTSLNSSMNAPGFSTHSEFIMPDGSSFD